MSIGCTDLNGENVDIDQVVLNKLKPWKPALNNGKPVFDSARIRDEFDVK
jgi:hypothetical protein